MQGLKFWVWGSLYLFFCDTWAEPPPVLCNGIWQTLSAIPNVRFVNFPLAQRVKWFQQTLRQYVRYSDGQWITKEVRPESSALQARLTCLPVRVPDSVWMTTEAYLSKRGGP